MTTGQDALAPESAAQPADARAQEARGLALARARRRGVLFVIGTLDLGGSESQLVLLALELKKRDWRVEVFSLVRGGMLAEPLDRAGIAVLYGRHRPNAPPVRAAAAGPPGSTGHGTAQGTAQGTARKGPRRPSLKAMAVLAHAGLRLALHIAARRPRVVHAFLPLTNFIGATAGRLACAPVVITSRRGLGNHQNRRPRAKWLDRTANRFSHVVLANSEAVARDTAARDGYDLGRIRVIPNGIDLGRFAGLDERRQEARSRLGLEPGDVAVVTVANLIPYKGHRDLVQALALAVAERAALKLFLVGADSGMGKDLLDQAEQLGVAANLRLMGRRDDIPGILSAMDVGVIASHEEGLCNALIEKLAAGLPAVATEVGGNPEVLRGMPGCVLVRPHDPGDLARGLLSVAARLPEPPRDRELRRCKVRQRYAVEGMVEAYERLYLTGRAG